MAPNIVSGTSVFEGGGCFCVPVFSANNLNLEDGSSVFH